MKEKNVRTTKKNVLKWYYANRFGKKGELAQIVLTKEEMQKLLARAVAGYTKVKL